MDLAPDNDWRSPGFRQKVVAQIEEAMRKAGTAHAKTSNEMENHVFIKAKSREEYLSLVARLIIHFRDIHKKDQGGPGPMNALQTLNGVGGGGPNTIGMGPRPGAPMGGMAPMGQMPMGQHPLQGVGGIQQDNDWRFPGFRQKVVAQIEEAMRKAGTAHAKTSNEMENHVFIKAKSREEYLSLVARLIIHFRDIHKKAQGGPDPMNALQTLTGVGGGGPNTIGMGPRPGAPMGGMAPMGQMPMGQHPLQGVGGIQQAGTAGQMPMQMGSQQQPLQFQPFQAQQQAAMQPQQQTSMQSNSLQQQQFQQLQKLQMHQQQQQQQHQQQQQQHPNQPLQHQNQQQQAQAQAQAQAQQQQQQQQNQVSVNVSTNVIIMFSRTVRRT
uniref:Mediator of RNA polymerase II transcription subunit 15 n=1 Tax=Astyanax mexicanus TaxID=7994 RepID=A0A3B1JJL3_ASTMX